MIKLSRIMIAMGVLGVAFRAEAQMQGEPAWLFRFLGLGAVLLLVGGLHLFSSALKREILEEVRKKNDDAAA